MALIKSVSRNIFNSTTIQKGNCIRAKRTGWDGFRNGFVTRVDEDKITCVYYVDSGNAVNYFDVNSDEVAAGLWEVYWTADFKNVFSQGVTASA